MRLYSVGAKYVFADAESEVHDDKCARCQKAFKSPSFQSCDELHEAIVLGLRPEWCSRVGSSCNTNDLLVAASG